MSGWAGFSDEELRRMQQKDSAASAVSSRGRKPTTANRNRQQIQREKALQLSAQRNSESGFSELLPGQQLTKPPKQESQTAAPPPAPQAPVVRLEMQLKDCKGENQAQADDSVAVKELEKREAELREKSRLELLQEEQKTMEEMNKRKKALLTKTIAEKSRQTQAEAVKLKRIQKELQALDDMVSNDIGILRSRIDQASWDYAAARKRYEKAEAEFVTAKMELHKKTEVKEQLTEHLCAIIQQNELRKARKLEELMQQLQLQTTKEELEKLRQEEEEEEEEQERKRSMVENHTDRKEGGGTVSHQENITLSIEDCKPPEERTEVKEVKEVKEETPVKTEEPKEGWVRNNVEAMVES